MPASLIDDDDLESLLADKSRIARSTYDALESAGAHTSMIGTMLLALSDPGGMLQGYDIEMLDDFADSGLTMEAFLATPFRGRSGTMTFQIEYTMPVRNRKTLKRIAEARAADKKATDAYEKSFATAFGAGFQKLNETERHFMVRQTENELAAGRRSTRGENLWLRKRAAMMATFNALNAIADDLAAENAKEEKITFTETVTNPSHRDALIAASRLADRLFEESARRQCDCLISLDSIEEMDDGQFEISCVDPSIG